MVIRIWVDENFKVPEVYTELDGEYVSVSSFEDLVRILETTDEDDIEVIDINLDQKIYDAFQSWLNNTTYLYNVCPHNTDIIRCRAKKRYLRYWRIA